MVLLGPGSIAKAILAQIFSGSSPEKLTAVAGAVGKVKIPRRLRDFQVRWKSPAFGLFPEPLFPRPFYPPRVQSRKYTEGECYDQEAIPAHARAGPPKTFRRPARPSVPTSQPGTHTPHLPGGSGSSRERKLDLSRLSRSSAGRRSGPPQTNPPAALHPPGSLSLLQDH